MKLFVMKTVLISGCTLVFLFSASLAFSQNDKKKEPKKEPVKLKQVKADKSSLKQIKKVSTTSTNSAKKK